MLINHLMSII